MSTLFDKWQWALRLDPSTSGPPGTMPVFPEGDWRHETLERIKDSQVFVFDGVEPNELPRLTDDEVGMFLDGYLPLPFDCCWFEIAEKNSKTGLHLHSMGNNEVLVQVFYMTKVGQLQVSGYLHCLTRNNATSLTMHKPWEPRDVFLGPRQQNKEFCENYTEATGVTAVWEREWVECALKLNLMINSATTKVTNINAPSKLNKARQKRGRLPFVDYRIVELAPKEILTCSQGGTHASPRLHWRRSHLRRYKSGKVVVIPRCLVGRADLGFINHEYKVSDA